MTVARYAFFVSLAAAATIAACSDSGSLTPELPKQSVSGTGVHDTSGSGGTGSGQTGGTGGDTAHANPGNPGGPDTVQTSPIGWPRTVLGFVQGVTYTPGQQDSVKFETIANATVTLYQIVQPTPPNYDSLPPRLYGTTTTNSAGEFTFADLPQAGYKVTVTPAAGSPYKETSVWFVPQEKVWRMGINLYR